MTWPALAVGLPVAVFAAVWVLRRSLLVVTVTGNSMVPTYHPGDRVLVRRRRVHQVRHGQIVVVAVPRRPDDRSPPCWLLKRAIAVPGDDAPDPFYGTVPVGRLLVLGDNTDASYDSRVFGYTEAADLLGTAVRRLTHTNPTCRR